MRKTLEQLEEIINSDLFNDTASYWLKNSILALKNRDIVDTLDDIEFLHIYFTEILKQHQDCLDSPFNK